MTKPITDPTELAALGMEAMHQYRCLTQPFFHNPPEADSDVAAIMQGVAAMILAAQPIKIHHTYQAPKHTPDRPLTAHTVRGYWNCDCGTRNVEGKLCSNCAPGWTCTCGSINVDDYCSCCGRDR